MSLHALPVDNIFSELDMLLQHHSRVVLQAEPGAGKSTRLPLLLLQQGQNTQGVYSHKNQILILEPRRVAARQIAHFLATQLNETVGQRIGLAMRGENVTSEKTVLTVITDGVLVKMLQQDPELTDIGLIIFDEFHERSLSSDLALALSIDSQQLNEALALLIMSATIDTQQLAKQLEASVISAQGRQFPIEYRYVPSELIPTIDNVVSAIKQALMDEQSSILVFLPGIADINRVNAKLNGTIPKDTDIFPLYGGLSMSDQVKAIAPAIAGRRKIVLATNIAQTSLTIEGIDVVVDSGQEKVNIYQPRVNADTLVNQSISKASATQRAGRAGRLRAGVCYRLGSEEHWRRKVQFDTAEIERSDLSQLLLEVTIWGAEFDELFWATKPDYSSIGAAEKKLLGLQYLEKRNNRLQSTGLCEQYQQFGTDLRLTRLLSYAASLDNVFALNACYLAAWLEVGLNEAQISVPSNIGELPLQPQNLPQKMPKKIQHQFRKFISTLSLQTESDWQKNNLIDSDLFGILLAHAFPDRIAKKTSKRWKMSNGGAVEFHHSNIPSNSEFIVVIDFSASQYGHYVRHYAELSKSQIEQYLASLVERKQRVYWSEQKRAPAAVDEVKIGELVIEQTPIKVNLDADQWQQVWLDYFDQHGLASFGNEQAKINEWLVKMTLMQQCLPDTWPAINELTLKHTKSAWLTPYLNNVRSLAHLQKLDVIAMLNSTLDWSQQQVLKEYCPSHYETPAGTKAKIDYTVTPPKISVRLQEMFGEPTSPAICNGKVPLLIELLSPARRAIQLTQDLAHFWSNAYVEVKKEMKGRYPKHRWPDSPQTETPGHSLKKKMSAK